MKQVNKKEISESIRIIETTTKKKGLEEYYSNFLSNVKDYEVIENENGISVNCKINGCNDSYELVSTEEHNILYESSWNIETNLFTLTISDNLGDIQQLSGNLLYDAHTDNYYLQNVEDENDTVLLADLVNNYILEECAIDSQIKFEDMIGGGGGGGAIAGAVAAITFVALAPKIVEFCDTVIDMIATTLEDFWEWFTGLFDNKNDEYLVYSIMIGTVIYETQAMTKASIKKLDRDVYYLCIADKEAKCFFFTTVTVTEEIAIAALESNVLINSLSGGNQQFVLSTWTKESSDAKYIAEEASFAWGYNGIAHQHGYEKLGVGNYMKHWHPGPETLTGTPHSFFGNPDV